MASRRQIAEALGVTVEYAEYPQSVQLRSGWYIRGLSGHNQPGGYMTEEAAWAALPNWHADPSAALALLAGDVYWKASSRGWPGSWIDVEVTAPPHDFEGRWIGSAPVINYDEAAAFAAAATDAWLAWKGEG